MIKLKKNAEKMKPAKIIYFNKFTVKIGVLIIGALAVIWATFLSDVYNQYLKPYVFPLIKVYPSNIEFDRNYETQKQYLYVSNVSGEDQLYVNVGLVMKDKSSDADYNELDIQLASVINPNQKNEDRCDIDDIKFLVLPGIHSVKDKEKYKTIKLVFPMLEKGITKKIIVTYKRNTNSKIFGIIKLNAKYLYGAFDGPRIISHKTSKNRLKLSSNLFHPTQQEVGIELDKQLDSNFSKNKKKAAEEFQLGLEEYQSFNFKAALEHFDKASKIYQIPSFYLAQGNSYANLGQLDEAVIYYDKAIQLNKDSANGYHNLGLLWLTKRDYDKALIYTDNAIQLNPNYAESYFVRGYIWSEKGYKDKALADYDKTILLNPKHDAAYNNRGTIWNKKGDLDKAFSDYSKAIQLNTNYATAYFNRGSVLLEKKRYDQVINDATRAIQLNPNYTKAYKIRGDALSITGDQDKAIEDYSKAIGLNPDYADAYNNRGMAWLKINNKEKARADYDKAIQLNPKHPNAYNNRKKLLDQFRGNGK